MGVLIVLLIIFFVACLFSCKEHAQEKQDQETVDNFYRIFEKTSTQFYNSNSVKKQAEYLQSLENAYRQGCSQVCCARQIDYFDKELNVLRNDLKENLIDDWYDQHDDLLNKLENMLFALKDTDFRTVDQIYHCKTKCLKLYRQYLDAAKSATIPLQLESHMQQYFKEEENGAFVLSEAALCSKLDAYIEKFKPLYERKKHLLSSIIKKVASVPDKKIRRCDLLKIQFGDSTPKERQICYDLLIEEKKLIEYRPQKYYWVSLPSKQN